MQIILAFVQLVVKKLKMLFVLLVFLNGGTFAGSASLPDHCD